MQNVISPSHGLPFCSTAQRSELKRYARRDVDLIALEEDDKVELWWNQNGSSNGWGDGGMVAIKTVCTVYSEYLGKYLSGSYIDK